MSEAIDAHSGGAPTRLFAAFEGGGAKGLVHVGALKALEARGFEFKAVAGTSAGAIVAVLKAAGYQADEIVDPVGRRTIFDTYKDITGRPLRPIGLFGSQGWRKIQLLRVLLGRKSRVAIRIIVALVVLTFCAFFLFQNVRGLHYLSTAVSVIGIPCFLLLLYLKNRGGITSLRTCRDALNTLIAAKLFPDDVNRIVVLSDFRRTGLPSLRIVAADITKRELRLFSSESDEDASVPVADVVAASVCIPLIFRPWEIKGRLHVDGGIVSNLPAWPFDEERALDLDALTLAFEIEDRGSRDVRADLQSWMLDVVLTAAFGASLLNKRAVDRLHVFRLGTDLNTLDFDVSLDRSLDTVKEARAAADALIARHLIDVPGLYTEGCRRVQSLAASALASIPNAIVAAPDGGRVRVCVAIAEPGFPKSLRLSYSVGFEDDADEGILLPREGSYIGDAWNEGVSVLGTPPFDVLPSPGSRRLNKLFAKDIRWILAVPVYRSDSVRREPDFVIAVDGSHVLKEDDQILDEVLTLLPRVVDEVFAPIATELAKEG